MPRPDASEEPGLGWLLDAAPDALVAFDSDGRILFVNAEAERLFACERAALVGVDLASVVPEGLPCPPLDVASGGAEASVQSARADVLLADGSRLGVEARVRAVRSPAGGVCFVATLRLAAADANDHPDGGSIGREFLQSAAHELGTPLTPIKLQVHLLRAEGAATLSAAQRRSLDVLERNVDRLQGLVRDVLDAARLQVGPMRLRREPLDLDRVLAEAAEAFEESARQAGVRLDVRLARPMRLEADPDRLTQVVFNLLANALKFTPRGGCVTLEAAVEGGEAVVRVRDTGAGFEPASRDRLFRPFSRVHDEAVGPREGTGLGLFISKGLVELHGGRIWAQSEGLGWGATFAFALPLRAAPPVEGERRVPVEAADEPAGRVARTD